MPIDKHGFRLPSLGQFLAWAVTAIGGIPTDAENGAALRKAVQRLSAGGDIDLSRYVEIKDYVIGVADRCTVNRPDHWLSGKTWRHVFSAYQFLLLNVITVDREPVQTSTMLLREVLGWFGKEYWLYISSRCDHTTDVLREELWFWQEPDTREVPLARPIIDELKLHMVGREASDWAFAKAVVALRMVPTKEAIGNEFQQLRDYREGRHRPEVGTLDALADRLASCDDERYKRATARLRVMGLTASFLWSLHDLYELFCFVVPDGQSDRMLFEAVLNILCELVERNAERVLYAIPSSPIMTLESRRFYVRVLIQGELDKEVVDGEAPSAAELFDDEEKEPTEDDLINKLNEIKEWAEFVYGRNGPSFERCLGYLIDGTMVIANNPKAKKLSKWALQQLHFHQSLDYSYQDSGEWRRLSGRLLTPGDCYLAGFVGDAEPAFESLVRRQFREQGQDFGEEPKLKKWRSRDIDFFVQKQPYCRTRLMLAVAYDNLPLANALLDAGADPWIVSRSTAALFGDNGTALLFAVQRHRRHFPRGHLENSAACIELIARLQAQHTSPVPHINLATAVRKLSCLCEAIRSTDPVVTELMIEMGADVNKPTGGDLQSPLYLALGELNSRAFIRKNGVDEFINHAHTRTSIQSQNTVSSAALGLLSSSQMHDFFNCTLGIPKVMERYRDAVRDVYPESDGDEERLLEIIGILLEHGADPDRIEGNGFSALGFCQEIEETSGDVGSQIARILRDYGATKVYRWSENQETV